MQFRVFLAACFICLVATEVWATAEAAHAAATTFNLLEVGSKPASSAFTDAQVAFVVTWVRAKAPECPVESAPAVAEKFLEDLQARHPEALDRLTSADFEARKFESMLLRHIGAQLTGANQVEQREAVAQRRVQTLLAAEGGGGAPTMQAAAAMAAKIKSRSTVSYRRLVEGRVDDDDLLVLIKQAGSTAGERVEAAAAPATPKELSAGEIISEYARRNQTGSALTRLHAYVVEAQLKTASGEDQHLFLYKLRPDRFRLLIQVGGFSRYILAYDGQRFWQQLAGKPAGVITPETVGSRRDFREFVDPLFEPESHTFERLADGMIGDRKCYRVAVRSASGPGYVACVDRENFHELGRENEDGARIRYLDFREVAGVTLSFREEATDHEGKTGVLEISRITPNPGLIQALFETPAQQQVDFFAIERLLAQTPAAATSPTGKAD